MNNYAQQLNLFNFGKETFKIEKPIRLIELFAGIGAQAKALEILGVPFEHYKICEWAAPSIKGYNAIHIHDSTDYSANLTKEQLIAYLEGNISTDYNDPCNCKKKPENWLREVYNNCIATLKEYKPKAAAEQPKAQENPETQDGSSWEKLYEDLGVKA